MCSGLCSCQSRGGLPQLRHRQLHADTNHLPFSTPCYGRAPPLPRERFSPLQGRGRHLALYRNRRGETRAGRCHTKRAVHQRRQDRGWLRSAASGGRLPARDCPGGRCQAAGCRSRAVQQQRRHKAAAVSGENGLHGIGSAQGLARSAIFSGNPAHVNELTCIWRLPGLTAVAFSADLA